MEEIMSLTDFYGVQQKVQYDKQKGKSQTNINSDDAQTEWKLF